ncbi:hypothetical protein AB0F15_11470 [Amycolatopsis sp. NPDC026612]|uniref:hypothetical protein n=1 Tax=Amycolatopsis sp. NPDC026612 TaxID=3155466 RepID=UPI0033F0BF86
MTAAAPDLGNAGIGLLAAAGVREQWTTYLADHTTGILAGNADAHQWIVKRFNGEPAPADC